MAEDLASVDKNPFRRDAPGHFPKQFKDPFERAIFEEIRRKADRPIQATGLNPSWPQEDQTPRDYRCRLVSELVARTNLKGADALIQQAADVADMERVVFDAALRTPEAQGKLVPIVTTDRSGREITEFVGDKKCWLQPFVRPAEVGAFIDPATGKFQRTPVIL